jgi:hypothetical protein
MRSAKDALVGVLVGRSGDAHTSGSGKVVVCSVYTAKGALVGSLMRKQCKDTTASNWLHH